MTFEQNKFTTENKKTVILILIAFAFSFAVRLIWVYQFEDYDAFKYAGQFMINTNDGYYWAEGARDILSGISQDNDNSPITSAVSQLTAFLATVLPFSFETVVFYMPAFFSSLIVIPIILIAREFDKLEVGFIAALVGSIAWSYYNRTMVGYFDSDFLNILFPTVLLWSLIWAIKEQDEKYFLIAALDSIAYRWWYPQSYSLELAFIGLVSIYVVYQYIKKQEFKVNLLLISFLLIAMIDIDSWIRLSIVIAFFIAIKLKKELVIKYLYYIFGASVLLFFVTGGFEPIIRMLKAYVFRDAVFVGEEGLKLHFFNVAQTVREAGKIPFETFANRISGHTITFIASVIGYIWMSIRYPAMLLALPMLGLGFLAYGIPGVVSGGGLRFTVYAVPVMALGLGYIIFEASRWLSVKLIKEEDRVASKYVLMALFTIAALYPNIKHAQEYKVPTVFTKQEVELLDKLKNVADREDYVVAWWDYGYTIRYYSDVKTLIDGAKHSGGANFPVSYILTNPQEQAAKMARLDVEYTEKRFAMAKDGSAKMSGSNIEQMTLDYGFTDTNEFLDTLDKNITLPEKTRDVYLYLPSRMMRLLRTVNLFSNLDLMTGEKKPDLFSYQSMGYKDDGEIIDLGNGISINKKKGEIQIGKKSMKMNNFSVTEYDQDGTLHKNMQVIDENSPINVIFMKSYNTFLVLDTTLYNSSYVQLFALENYDENLFEPVILNPLTKVYKLKI